MASAFFLGNIGVSKYYSIFKSEEPVSLCLVNNSTNIFLSHLLASGNNFYKFIKKCSKIDILRSIIYYKYMRTLISSVAVGREI